MKKILEKIKHIFLAHEGNDHKPHILRHKSILSIFYFVIVIELLFLTQIFFVFEKTNFLASVLPGALTAITNEQRTENNLPTLKENELLKKAATLKAQDMAEKGYFSHNTPDGKTPWYWLNLVGYKYNYAGENLAVNFFDSYDVAEAWMASPSHRANIVKESYTEIGIGVANGKYKGKDTVFVVQFFGKPTEKSKAVPIAKTKDTTKQLAEQNTKNTQPEVLGKEAENTIATIQTEELEKEIKNIISQIEPIKEIAKEKINFWQKILLSPLAPIKYTFGTISIVLALVLLFTIFITTEIKHPKMVFKGLALFSLVVFLLIVNINASTNKTIISQEAQVTSFIAS